MVHFRPIGRTTICPKSCRYPNEQHLQGGLQFSTQIWPLLNFVFKIKNDPKFFDQPINGRLAGPKYMRCQFFIKYTYFEFLFYTGNCRKVWNWAKLGRLADTPICSKQPPIVGPQKHELRIFSQNRPPFNFDFVLETVAKFEIGPNWANWQTPPFVQNSEHCGAPNIWVYIFLA